MGITLKFHARGDLLVMHPEARHMTGQPAHYIGRTFVQAVKAKPATKSKKAEAGSPASYPADKVNPFECDSGGKVGIRLAKLCRRDGSLWPADEATASHCGVKHVPVKHVSGEWVAASKGNKPPKE